VPSQLVCLCNHLTSFTIGVLTININALVIPPTIDLNSKGLIAAWVTIGGLLFVYIVLSVFAIISDNRYMSRASKPAPRDVVAFVEKAHQLYLTPVTARVLRTVPSAVRSAGPS
jgi:hypothetical protein